MQLTVHCVQAHYLLMSCTLYVVFIHILVFLVSADNVNASTVVVRLPLFHQPLPAADVYQVWHIQRSSSGSETYGETGGVRGH